MKRFNYFVMSLISAAAFTFTACSSSDDLGGNSNKQEVAADGYYMTLTVKSPTSVGTRTAQQGKEKEVAGTDAESTITTGAIYLYNEAGTLIFSKNLSANDWVNDVAPTKEGTTKPFKVAIKDVEVGKKYYVYFVANASKTDYANPLTNNLEVKAGVDAAANNKFLMFNQNDESKQANHSTVTFTEASKNIANKVTAGVIYLDRVVARIDKPTVENPEIKNKDKVTKTGNINIIKGVAYDGYALTNEAQKSYLVQNWGTETAKNVWTLTLPGMTYDKPNSYYGTTYKAQNLKDFGLTDVNYVFENTTNAEENATGMYFKFTVTLKDDAAKTKDFTDGTFLRYNNKIYASLKDLYDESNTEVWPFVNADNSTMSYTEAFTALQAAVEKAKANDETDLEQIRQATKINVYVQGATYYKTNINDQYYTPTGYFSILRNSVYRLTVNSIWDLGKDVPNGPDSPEEENYWMDVTVNVNPWVLNTIGVDLQ